MCRSSRTPVLDCSSSTRHAGRLLLHLWIVNCAVTGLNVFYSPVCFEHAKQSVPHSQRTPGLDCSCSTRHSRSLFFLEVRCCRAEQLRNQLKFSERERIDCNLLFYLLIKSVIGGLKMFCTRRWIQCTPHTVKTQYFEKAPWLRWLQPNHELIIHFHVLSSKTTLCLALNYNTSAL